MSTNPKFYFVLVFAGAIDAVDYIGGAIPIIGDVIDIAGVAIYVISGMGIISAIGLLELIPFGVDFLPLHVGAVVLAWKLGKFNS